jgi:hypothetical protein
LVLLSGLSRGTFIYLDGFLKKHQGMFIGQAIVILSTHLTSQDEMPADSGLLLIYLKPRPILGLIAQHQAGIIIVCHPEIEAQRLSFQQK